MITKKKPHDSDRNQRLDKKIVDTENNIIQKDNSAKVKDQKISFTLVIKKSGILTKHIKRNPQKEICKDSSKCVMSEGKAQSIKVTIDEFAERLRGYTPNQAIIHGICPHAKADIVSRVKFEQLETQLKKNSLPVITRTKDYFNYPDGPGLLLLDHDKASNNVVSVHDKAHQSYTPEELIQIIGEIFPEILSAAYVSTFSTSACIYDSATGEELRGRGAGFHLYLFPKNAQDVPRFLKTLGQRLILAGYGRIEISRAGVLLIRTLVDLLVGSPERLDFVAGAVCDTGLEQRLPKPEHRAGKLLDSEKLPSLSQDEEKKYQELIQQLKEKARPKKQQVVKEYIEQEASTLIKKSKAKLDKVKARAIIKSRQKHILANEDLLYFAHVNDKPTTVAEVLANVHDYDHKPCADPLEPDYDGGSKNKAKFYWNNGRPLIKSFAHGGINYKFAPFSKERNKDKKYDSPIPLVKKNEKSQPFPFEVLGPTMAVACKIIQENVQAPDAIIAQSVLGAANLAVQGLGDIIIDGRVFPISLFLLSIAGTGERKSAVDNLALLRHREIEKNNIAQYTSEQISYEINKAAFEHERSVLTKDRKKSLEEKQAELEILQKKEPIKPLNQILLVSDFTFEGLFKLFQAGTPSKGLFADEGGQVTGGHGMKKESILATAAGLSKFWDGTRVDRIRVIDGFSHLYGRRLSVHLMMQEQVGLKFYTNDVLIDQGLTSRFLPVWPTSTIGSRLYVPLDIKDSAAMVAFYENVSAALNIECHYKEDSNDQELDPPQIPLNSEAKQLWTNFYNRIEEQSGPKKNLTPVRGFANKAAEHAARVAGTIQLFKDPTSTKITARYMKCGIDALEWFINEALRISNSSVPDSDLLQAKKVLQWIHDKWLSKVTLPDIYQYSPVRSASRARKVANILKNHNHLIAPELPTGQCEPDPIETMCGKVSREWWIIHPDSKRSFNND